MEEQNLRNFENDIFGDLSFVTVIIKTVFPGIPKHTEMRNSKNDMLTKSVELRDGVVVRATASQSADLGFIP